MQMLIKPTYFLVLSSLASNHTGFSLRNLVEDCVRVYGEDFRPTFKQFSSAMKKAGVYTKIPNTHKYYTSLKAYKKYFGVSDNLSLKQLCTNIYLHQDIFTYFPEEQLTNPFFFYHLEKLIQIQRPIEGKSWDSEISFFCSILYSTFLKVDKLTEELKESEEALENYKLDRNIQ